MDRVAGKVCSPCHGAETARKEFLSRIRKASLVDPLIRTLICSTKLHDLIQPPHLGPCGPVQHSLDFARPAGAANTPSPSPPPCSRTTSHLTTHRNLRFDHELQPPTTTMVAGTAATAATSDSSSTDAATNTNTKTNTNNVYHRRTSAQDL